MAERAATAVALLAASWLTYSAIENWRTQRAASSLPVETGYARGEALEGLAGARFDAVDRTVVVFVRTSCRACSQSLPFYRRLAERCGKSHGRLQIVVAAAEPLPVVNAYLDSARLRPSATLRIHPERTRIKVVPTVLVVDSNGAVLLAAGGYLSRQREEGVWKCLTGGP